MPIIYTFTSVTMRESLIFFMINFNKIEKEIFYLFFCVIKKALIWSRKEKDRGQQMQTRLAWNLTGRPREIQ